MSSDSEISSGVVDYSDSSDSERGEEMLDAGEGEGTRYDGWAPEWVSLAGGKNGGGVILDCDGRRGKSCPVGRGGSSAWRYGNPAAEGGWVPSRTGRGSRGIPYGCFQETGEVPYTGGSCSGFPGADGVPGEVEEQGGMPCDHSPV